MLKQFCAAAKAAAWSLVVMVPWAAGADVLWIADDGTNTIYEVTLDGVVLSSFPEVLGSGSGLAIDVDPLDGSLWGADEKPARIVNFTKTGELISYFTGDAFGAVAPEGIGVADDGTLWIVDDPRSDSDTVAKVFHVTKTGRLIASFPMALFDPDARSPQAISVDPFDGTLWITDNRTDLIYNVSTEGKLIAALPTELFDAAATNIQGISVDEADGSLWTTDRDSARVYNISRSGKLLSSFHSTSFDPNALNPTGIAFDASVGLRGNLEEMAHRLVAMRGMDERFGWAGERCEKASSPYFWETEDTLDEHGAAVFRGLMGGVWNLRQVPGRPAHEARRAIHRLVSMAAHLARNAIEDAVAAGGDETRIRTARLWLRWGHHVMEDGRPLMAIYLFKHAWAYAYAAG
jgi:DNA-binding beta-propeller fold protein YncE